LFDALDQRLGVVAKTQAGLEDIAFLQVAKCEVVLNLLVDAVHAVFDCDFFMLFYLSCFCFWFEPTVSKKANAGRDDLRLDSSNRPV
jgi:hypothetical protein